METNASGQGIGAALMQEGHPIAYFSKALSSKHQSLSTYEEELMAVGLGSREMEALPVRKAFHYQN